MSEAQNEKSKKKGKPAYFPGWLKLLVVALSIIPIGLCAAIGGIVLLWMTHTHDFSQKEVAEACISLRLPSDSAFCTEPTQNTETLQKLLEQMYPPDISTVEDLEAHFMSSFTCEGPITCRLTVPINFVTVRVIHEEGSNQIAEYALSYDD